MERCGTQVMFTKIQEQLPQKDARLNRLRTIRVVELKFFGCLSRPLQSWDTQVTSEAHVDASEIEWLKNFP